MAWSLDERTGPTRPLQVTCTLVVRWWASSLSGALLTGAQACAAELAKRRLPSASFVPRPGPPHTTHTTWRAQGEGTTSTTTKPPMHTKTTTREPPRRRPPTRRHTLGVLRALIFLRSNASLLPFYCSAPPPPFQLLREASRKGACPPAPLPARRAGDEKIILGPGPRRFIPPKRDPSFT